MQTSLLSIKHLVSEAQWYEAIRQLRWKNGVACPCCDSNETIRRGFDGPDKHLRRYGCKSCGRRFDDLTGTALSVWVLCLYFMGLNLSNIQIAQAMTECLRDGLVKKRIP
jgi:transposase-like protein